MTQNKKKGIAKKALSISLVAAMLATSNVPVWASGFEAVDPEVEVQEFMSEGEVETVDNYDNTVNVQAVADYKVETNLELTTTTDGDWSGELTTALTKEAEEKQEAKKFEITDKDGAAVTPANVEVYYNGDMQGKPALAWNTDLDTTLSGASLDKNVYKEGGKVEAKVYVKGETDPVITFSTTLKPVDITGEAVTYTEEEKEYNGTKQMPTGEITTAKGSATAKVSAGELAVVYPNVNDGVNVGTYPFQVEGVEAEGYIGTSALSADGLKIIPATVTKDNLKVEVSGEVAYNGKAVVPTVVVTDKLTNTVVPSELYTVAATNTNAGTYTSTDAKNPLNVKITMKETAPSEADASVTLTNNFTAGEVIEAVANEIYMGSYTISPLDLSKLDNKYDITVNAKEKADSYTFTKADFIFTDKATKEVVDVLPDAGITYTATAADGAASGTVTVAPSTAGDKNIVGSLSKSFTIAKSTISADDVFVPENTVIDGTNKEQRSSLTDLNSKIVAALEVSYDGTAQEPLKNVFSNLVQANQTAGKDDIPFVLGTDYDVVYSDNTNVATVSNKQAKVALVFKGQYTGTISYNITINEAEVTVTPDVLAYEAGKTSYEATAKLTFGKDKKEVPADAYTWTSTKAAYKVGEIATAKIEITNKNYVLAEGGTTKNINSVVVGKSLKDSSITAAVEGTYVYTGKAINPTIVVKDGAAVLTQDKDYKVVSKSGTNAGEASVTIEGKDNYSDQLVLKYNIEKADIKDAVVNGGKAIELSYSGLAQAPTALTVKLGDAVLTLSTDNGKTGDYLLECDKNNTEVGTYTFKLVAAPGSKKVTGVYEGTYKIIPAKLTAAFATKANPNSPLSDGAELTPEVTYTGKAITLDDLKTKYVVVDKNNKNEVLTEGKDYELIYTNNTDAGKATVTAYGLGNHAVVDKDGEKVAIASATFTITGTVIEKANITKVSDVEYAGGLYVEPQVTVKVGDKVLVQGKDYTVTTKEIEVGDKTGGVTVTGKGAYTTTDKANTPIDLSTESWKVVAKDLKNCTVSLDSEGNVVVKNGEITVPSSEYTVTENEDGTFTVEASKTTKNYTGSVKVNNAAPEATTLKVTDRTTNTVTVGWDEVEGAEGYTIWFRSEYDDSVQRKIVNGGNVTEWTHKGLQAGTKYFYTVKAWVKTEDGYVFSEQSPVQRGTTKPMAAKIASVTANDGKVKVKLTGAVDGAEMYSMCYSEGGNKFNENDFKVGIRTSYTTRTMKDTLEPGTYWVAVKSYRDLGNNKRVYGAWSNAMKVVVK